MKIEGCDFEIYRSDEHYLVVTVERGDREWHFHVVADAGQDECSLEVDWEWVVDGIKSGEGEL